MIIIDNTQNLNDSLAQNFFKQMHVKHLNSTPYKLQINGALEEVNKNINNIIRKMVVTYKN